ncbi:MAG: PH domain-containing protein [Parcubacteria group bacterium]|nr:PH domain-containing protein [Parcubacteria group bacterium]
MLHIELEPDENIILEVRKHWFVFLGPIIFFILCALIPFFLYTFFHGNASQIDVSFIDDNFFVLTFFFYPIWLLALTIGFFIRWTDYYLDVWYVTQKRIIDVEQKNLFYREISNLRFDRIQDISIEVRGFIATFLNFGDLNVETAGEGTVDFSIRNVSNPERIKRVIFAQHNIVWDKLDDTKI